MIIEKTIGGTLYQNNSKTLKVWVCSSTNNTTAVWNENNKEKTLKRFVKKTDALSYATFLVYGE